MAALLLLKLLMLALAVPAGIGCLYLLQQTLLSWPLPPPPRSRRELKFDLIVPAHNEAGVIARTIANLKRIDWPADRFRILVVADNCTDDTAAIARAAGASVIERQDDTLRGKGYALQYAFAHSLRECRASAIAVVDADAEVSTNLLEAFASRLERGAQAIQVHYGVLDPDGSWRTRLLAIAMAAYHIVRSRARERQHVSSGIRGNGWCVTRELLQQTPYSSFSLAEDIEYGIALGLAGHRVWYAGEAEAAQHMTADPLVARKQRQRWEFGRFRLIRTSTLPLLRAALTRPSGVCLDLALDLIVLPITYVALNVGALLLLALLANWLWPGFRGWMEFSLGCVAAIALYVARGWSLSGTGLRGLLDLIGAPIFIIWKVMLMLTSRPQAEWVRTERKQHP